MDDERFTYNLDEGLAAVGFGKFQGLLLAYAGLGYFAEAMEIMILSFVGPAVKSEWGLSSSEESLLTTVVFAGMLLGAYSWGVISDKYGRRKGFLGITLITSAAGFFSTFSTNFISLLTLRCLVGVGLGGGPVFCSWFLEFVPISHRGTWMVVYTTFWTFGTIFEASLAWIVMPRLGWRWLLVLSSLPSIAQLFFYYMLPESPRYLCMKGRITDAQNILGKIALLNKRELPAGMLGSDSVAGQDAEYAQFERASLLLSTRKKVPSVQSGFSSFFFLFSSTLIRITLLLWVLFFGNSFSYYGIILLSSDLSSSESNCGSRTLHLENFQDNRRYIDVFITSLAELPGILLSAIIVDRFGRKLSIVILFVLACIFLFPLIFHQAASLRIAMLFGARMCTIGTFTVACIYAPELYPTSVRATGAGVASAVGRIGGMICPLVAVGLVTGCRVTEAIILFLVIIASSAVCVMFFPVETSGRELIDSLDVLNSAQVPSVS